MSRRVAPLACGCALAAAGAYVAINDPTSGASYPQCTFRQLTGLWCPGCGLTRGTHELFSGDVAGAVATNLFTPLVIVLLVAGWIHWTRRAFGAAPARMRVPAGAWLVAAAVVVLFGVLRNIPAEPFRALAP